MSVGASLHLAAVFRRGSMAPARRGGMAVARGLAVFVGAGYPVPTARTVQVQRRSNTDRRQPSVFPATVLNKARRTE